MEIESTRLKLLEISWDDAADIHRLHSFPEVDEFNTLGIPKDIEETREFMRPLIEAQAGTPRTAYTWKIVLKGAKEFIGLAGLKSSGGKFRLGEIWYKILPSHWGKGYATEAAKAMIKAGFDVLHIHKIEAGVAVGNSQSIRVLEKCGMTREGLRRKILPIRGSWADNYLYAILEDDPREY